MTVISAHRFADPALPYHQYSCSRTKLRAITRGFFAIYRLNKIKKRVLNSGA